MKIAELKKLNQGELEEKLQTLQKDLFHLKFQAATGQLENGNQVRGVRRDIARIKTLLHEGVILGRKSAVKKVLQSLKKKLSGKAFVTHGEILRAGVQEEKKNRNSRDLAIKNEADKALCKLLNDLISEISSKVVGKENRVQKNKDLKVPPAAYKIYLRLKKTKTAGKVGIRPGDLKTLESLGIGSDKIKEIRTHKAKKLDLLDLNQESMKKEEIIIKSGLSLLRQKSA